MPYPDWVLKQRATNTEIRHFGNNYYLYEVRTQWDKVNKRPKKTTGRYLGRITENGLLKTRRVLREEKLRSITVKEYGASQFLLDNCTYITEPLKKAFPNDWERILTYAILRLMWGTTLMEADSDFHSSCLSETLAQVNLSERHIGQFLRELGMNRGGTIQFLKSFITHTEYAIVDLTHVFSLSEDVISSVTGYNGDGDYTPQIRLTVVYDLDRHLPSYYRMVVGSIKDVTALKLAMKESGAQHCVLIGDKGFHSAPNVKELRTNSIHYILPLKRNNSMVEYRKEMESRKCFDGHFLFEGRAIWQYSYPVGEDRVILYLDSSLKAEEEKDWMRRMDDKKQAEGKGSADPGEMEKFFSKESTQGTIAVLTDTKESAEDVYAYLKGRAEIEQAFDTFKNTLNADRSYMRDDYQLEGWMMVNFVALMLYYGVYNQLKERKLLKRYTPKNVLKHLSRVYKLKVEDKWYLSEVPKKSRLILQELKYSLPPTT